MGANTRPHFGELPGRAEDWGELGSASLFKGVAPPPPQLVSVTWQRGLRVPGSFDLLTEDRNLDIDGTGFPF